MTPYEWTFLYYILLCLFVLVYSFTSSPNKLAFKNSSISSSIAITLVVLLYIGFREIDRYFADTVTYDRIYLEFCDYPMESMSMISDYGFSILTLILSYLRSDRLYFIILGCLYVLPLFYVFKKNFKESYYVMLLLFICSFSFIGYGVNGLRNGLATTFLICAFFNKKLIGQLIWIIIAVSMHKSALLPAAVFLVARRFSNPKLYLSVWVACLGLTVVAHGFIGEYLASITFLNDGSDTRLNGYFTGQFDGGETGNVVFSSTGFRYDFLIYSMIPIVLGWYFMKKKQYENELYKILYCVYVGCNAFWLLCMYIPFNNRFAYLSWFIYPVVMSYPLLQQKGLIPQQSLKIRLMVFFNFLFTFLMWIK